MTRFFVAGRPQGKARPRFARGRAYTPKSTVEYEKRIAESYNGDKMDGAICIFISAVFDIPKSTSKKERQRIIDEYEYPMKKPDADNIAKVVLDALNGIAYEDDKQVVYLSVEKRYTHDNTYNIKREGLLIDILPVNDISSV